VETVVGNNGVSHSIKHRLRFNWTPLAYINSSWLAEWITDSALSQVKLVPTACAQINQFLLEEYQLLSPIEAEEFDDPVLGALIRAPVDIDIILLYLGLVLHHSSIRNIICGQKQRELKQEIGDVAYFFTLTRAPFVVGSIHNRITSEVMNAEFTIDQVPIDRQRYISSGLVLFSCITRHLTSASKSRVSLLFHRQLSDVLYSLWESPRGNYSNGQVEDKEFEHTIETLFHKVIQESQCNEQCHQ